MLAHQYANNQGVSFRLERLLNTNKTKTNNYIIALSF